MKINLPPSFSPPSAYCQCGCVRSRRRPAVPRSVFKDAPPRTQVGLFLFFPLFLHKEKGPHFSLSPLWIWIFWVRLDTEFLLFPSENQLPSIFSLSQKARSAPFVRVRNIKIFKPFFPPPPPRSRSQDACSFPSALRTWTRSGRLSPGGIYIF